MLICVGRQNMCFEAGCGTTQCVALMQIPDIDVHDAGVYLAYARQYSDDNNEIVLLTEGD